MSLCCLRVCCVLCCVLCNNVGVSDKQGKERVSFQYGNVRRLPTRPLWPLKL